MQHKPFHVLIIGGGIAGPALALFLKKAGISSSLFETYPLTLTNTVGGGLGLAPNGMKVLNALGLSETIKQKGTIITKYSFKNGNGKRLAGYDAADPNRYGEPMVTFARPLLFELLADQMKKERIDVHYEKKLLSIENHANKVTAHFADGTSVDGDILIGADGVRSTARRYVLPEGPEPAYSGIIGIGGFVPLAAIPSFPVKELDTMTFMFGQNGFFGYAGGNKDALMWWSNIFREEPYPKEDLQNLDVQAIKNEMLARFGDYKGPVRELISNTTNLLRLNVYDILSLPTWHKERVLLIGDAAHTVSPNAGQGASMALEDAMYLAKLLRDRRGEYAQAFAKFEQDRKPRAERVVAEGRRRGKDKAIVSAFEQKIRELMMRVFIGLFGKNSDQWLFEYQIDWE